MTELFQSPIIDVQEHNRAHATENLAVNKIKNEPIKDNVEILIIMHSILKHAQHNQPINLNQDQRFRLCGLMKRLLMQIPTREPL